MMQKITAKLLAARQRMSFEKERKSGLDYDVFDGDTILEMVGNALAAENILFVPSMVGAQMDFSERQKEGRNNTTYTQYVQHALCTLELRFIDMDSGETLEAMTHGSAMDINHDKALGKAQTYAIKYFFIRMFLKGKSDIDDEERQHNDDTPARRGSSKPAPKNGAQNGDSDLDAVKVLAADTFPFEDAWKGKEWEALIKKKPNWNTAFWATVGSLNVTNDELHKALNVESMNDYTGKVGVVWLEVCKLSLAKTA